MLSDIIAAIKTIMLGVSGVEIVHEYQRFAADWTKFLSLFKDSSDRINGWMITRESTPEDRDTYPTLRRQHRFVIRGFYGLNDAEASETTFQTLVERIQTAFDVDPVLGGTVINSEPLQVDKVDARVFGSVLCHYAELSIAAHERVFCS